jgi:antitoxin CptB
MVSGSNLIQVDRQFKCPPTNWHWIDMDRDTRIKRLGFRAWHRGTREADMMLGGFFDVHALSWNEAEIGWYEDLLEEQDVDIMAWAIGVQPVPDRWQGPMMKELMKLDFIKIAQ